MNWLQVCIFFHVYEHYNDVIYIICIQFEKYFQICIFIAPNVSYYLPDYKPPNPEVPVVHGLPSATEKQYEVEEVPYEQKPKVSFILQKFKNKTPNF